MAETETTLKTTEIKPKKKKARKIFKRILCALLSLIVLTAAVTAAANAIVVKSNVKVARGYNKVAFTEEQLVPEKDANGNWAFTTDRNFRVMQLTDIHLGGGYMCTSKDRQAMNAVAAMITKEQPDLVVVTGDAAYPVPFQAGTFNNKSGAKELANLFETLGVYWTIVFGNHDTEAYSYYSREKISEFYGSGEFPHCLFQAGPAAVDGFGNAVIEIKNTKGLVSQTLIFLDSHSYTDGDIFGIGWKYDNIHENQIAWYESEIKRVKAENAAVLETLGAEECKKYSALWSAPSLAFFHIPLAEYLDAWTEFEKNGFKDTENVRYIEGIIGETGKRVYCGIGEDALFETMQKLGSTKGIFCGHDHYNNITVDYKGICLTYGMSVDCLAYSGISKNGSQRGCTMITIPDGGAFYIDKYNYYSDRYVLDGFTREEVTQQFADVTYEVPVEEK